MRPSPAGPHPTAQGPTLARGGGRPPFRSASRSGGRGGASLALLPVPAPPPRVLPTSAVFSDYATHCRPAAHKARAARPGTPSPPPLGVPIGFGGGRGETEPAASLDNNPLLSPKSPNKPWSRVPHRPFSPHSHHLSSPQAPGPGRGDRSGSSPIPPPSICFSPQSLLCLHPWVLPCSPSLSSPRPNPCGGLPEPGQQPGQASTRGHRLRDKLQAGCHSYWNLQLFSGTRWFSQPQSQVHTPHDAGSGSSGGHQPLSPLGSPGLGTHHPLMWGHTCSHPPPTHMSSARVAGHMGARGLRITGSLGGAHRQVHPHTGSHTHAQSHGHTQSHGRTQAHTQGLMFLQVTLVLPPRVAGTPGILARMLTVVLELGLPHTKSLPLLPALWASLAHRPPTRILPPDPGCREELPLPLPVPSPWQVGSPPPLDPVPTPCSSQNSLAGPSKPIWRCRQSREAGTEQAWVSGCGSACTPRSCHVSRCPCGVGRGAGHCAPSGTCWS